MLYECLMQPPSHPLLNPDTVHTHTQAGGYVHRTWSNRFSVSEPYVWVFASVVQTSTVWMVLLVTVDRYVAICKPFQVSEYACLDRASKRARAPYRVYH